ncbi:MAG: hypothetical protein EWV60_21720 [Microcystis sp. Msp_OC_L_20101000_S702]|jgi:hypothetical protein|uniref:hypothetical protein n=2 Tax=Microcystaceae TaxID=1890449 RepID=UPI001194B9E4|nr:hypothetical protein [Microcystis sp. Msp_OC_L_20101000_S702]TRU03958.1 MAG: hypothetical protein EWV60_21720 [Microcystis sp. Msp_OC_L_20101000_S702]
MLLSFIYVNNDNPKTTPFVLRKDTYDKLFPFLLGTVAVGGFALAYTRIQRSKEEEIARKKAAKALLERRIKRLQEIYTIVLTLYQNIRLQLRRLSIAFIFDKYDGQWKIRRSLFEEVLFALNESQMAGEKIVKTLEFEQDAIKSVRQKHDSDDEDNQEYEKLIDDLRAQIGGIEGVLRNVLKLVEWQSITVGTSSEEDLVAVPQKFVNFVETSSTGNLGFLKIIQYFNKFSKNIRLRIAILETEHESYGNES